MTTFSRQEHNRTNAHGTTFSVREHDCSRTEWEHNEHKKNYFESFTFLTRCPVCDRIVFFYSNENGSRVFFDDLGPPWPKHPCTISFSPITKSPTEPHPQAREFHEKALESLKHAEKHSGGFSPCSSMVDRLPIPFSQKSLIRWFETYGPMSWINDKQGKRFKRNPDKLTNQYDFITAKNIPFWIKDRFPIPPPSLDKIDFPAHIKDRRAEGWVPLFHVSSRSKPKSRERHIKFEWRTIEAEGELELIVSKKHSVSWKKSIIWGHKKNEKSSLWILSIFDLEDMEGKELEGDQRVHSKKLIFRDIHGER